MAPARPPLASRRGLAAAGTLLAGLLNIAIAPGRAGDWFTEGLTLGILGGLQIALATTLVVSPRPWIARAVIATNTAVVAGLAYTRTLGYPFGPWNGYSPDLGAFALIVLISSAIGAVSVAFRRSSSPDDVGLRFENLAPCAVAIVAVPGLLLSSWSDEARHMLGAGHAHPTAVTVQLDDEQQAALDTEIARAADVARRLPTLADALSAGWVLSGPDVASVGQMVVHPDIDFRNIAFDIDTPLGYLYESDDPTSPVIGLEYAQWMSHGETPYGFTGQSPMWHMHMASCVVDGTYAVPQEDPVTGPSCSLVDGRVSNSMSYMLRVWPLPDYPNPDGYFAHENPALES